MSVSNAVATLSLKSMLVASKGVDVEFPGSNGFVVSIAFLSRDTLQSIRKKATKVTFKNRAPVEELDEDLFLSLYVDNAIKGWKGLKLSFLEKLAPVDLGTANLEDELVYDKENALFLMKSSTNFDSWISDTVTDLANFPKSSSPKL